MSKYILAFDQSTQGTKALLFAENGQLTERVDLPHEQIINEEGWVSHNPEEIYRNVIETARLLIAKTGIDSNEIVGIGISNQRETSVAWNRTTGKPIADAIVWQCARAAAICARLEQKGIGEMVRSTTGIPLSPYFPASKYAWFVENVPGAGEEMAAGNLCFGTIDSWLVYSMTGGKVHATDYTNASRTQLFDIFKLEWSEEICNHFGIDVKALPQVKDSNALYGYTNLEGVLPKEVPIHSVLGDSHGALFGQGCVQTGMTKTTYGTGSSIMMNIGKKPILSTNGLVTSLAWGMDGEVTYCLEGNLNYTGAVISWLKQDVGLITSAGETEALANAARKEDTLYLIPAFSGLGAPYWDSDARAALVGMSRTTGKNEIVRASLECIAYQIKDIVEAMCQDIVMENRQEMELRVDGGPTKNRYLMQFQSDILDMKVAIPDTEELSGIGAAWAAGLALKVWGSEVFDLLKRTGYEPHMEKDERKKKYDGWKAAVCQIITNV